MGDVKWSVGTQKEQKGVSETLEPIKSLREIAASPGRVESEPVRSLCKADVQSGIKP